MATIRIPATMMEALINTKMIPYKHSMENDMEEDDVK